jgi:hypothetical protein
MLVMVTVREKNEGQKVKTQNQNGYHVFTLRVAVLAIS